ncbi:contractile injection system protein, VgrG/Pvc8 family [Paenibacillus elgii]
MEPIIRINQDAISLRNPKVRIVQRLNEHARAYFTGVIKDEIKERYVDMADASTTLEISYQGEDKKLVHLFRGRLTNIRVRAMANVYYIVGEAVSRTYDMDMKIKRRPFQNPKLTYSKLVEQVLEPYKGANWNSSLDKTKSLQKFTMQYDETDWEFLKRMASRFRWGLIPNATATKPQFYFGPPPGVDKGELTSFNFSVTRKMDSGMKDGAKSNLLYYKIYSSGKKSDLLNIGDFVTYKNRSLYVLQSISVIHHGVLKHEYVLTTSDGLLQKPLFNSEIKGISLKGKVLAVEEDQVKVHFHEIDTKKPPVAEICSFPHATFYTAEGDTGWYCMPEIDDEVNIYFPSDKEEEAIVTHSIRKKEEEGDLIKQPEVKIFMTRHRKAIAFTNNEILITGKDDEVLIRLIDDHGIEIHSKKDIRIKAEDNLLLQAGNTVQISAQNTLGLKCKTSLLELDGDVKIQGEKVKTN